MRLGITWKEKLGRSECPYIERWVLNFHFFSIRLHHFLYSDDTRAPHDHPWWFITFVLKGGYTDRSPENDDYLKRGSIRFRSAHHRHSVIVDPGGVWTLLITGRPKRKWGFWVEGKFRKSNKYFFMYGHPACEDNIR